MVLFAASTLDHLGKLDAAIVALLGYAVVFFGLILLMIVVIAIGKIFTVSAKKKSAITEEEQIVAPVVETPAAPVAPGTAGALKLHDVEPRTAAMLMAIVADKMGKPLNELRFLSIKEVK